MKKFYCPLFGVVSLGMVYNWIKALVGLLGYSHVSYDPIFDIVEEGQSVDVEWFDRTGNRKILSFVRVA